MKHWFGMDPRPDFLQVPNCLGDIELPLDLLSRQIWVMVCRATASNHSN
jgi:hypothetical protein